MSIFHKVTLKTMREAKSRTIVTIISVILSAAMFCAVTTFGASLRGFLIDEVVTSSGDYFGAATNLSREDADALMKDNRISQVGTLEFQGFQDISDWNCSIDHYVTAAAANEAFFGSMPGLRTGRLPENSGELLVPDALLSLYQENGTPLEIGDTITLDLGWRSYADGTALGQMECYVDGWGEELSDVESHTYTIVGTMDYESYDYYDLPAVICLTARDENIRSGPVSVYFKTHNPKTAEAVLQDMPHPDGSSWWLNNNLLNYYGVSKYNSINDTIWHLAAIFILIIMVGSVSLIHNAFSISVSERSRKFGLLSSIGATKKQLRKMIFSEAWTVSLIGIPIGAAAGVGGIGITLRILRGTFAKMMGDSEFLLRLHFSWPAVGAAALISLLTVFISAWIPARRATRVTAIEAIRQTQDVQVSRKAVKTGHLTAKLFGLEGLLAKKYFKCSRKKYRATVVSLALSVVLFISASSFSMYLNSMLLENFTVHNYDVSLYLHGADINLFQSIRALPSVEKAAYMSWGDETVALTDFENITPDYQNFRSQIPVSYDSLIKMFHPDGLNILKENRYNSSTQQKTR